MLKILSWSMEILQKNIQKEYYSKAPIKDNKIVNKKNPNKLEVNVRKFVIGIPQKIKFKFVNTRKFPVIYSTAAISGGRRIYAQSGDSIEGAGRLRFGRGNFNSDSEIGVDEKIIKPGESFSLNYDVIFKRSGKNMVFRHKNILKGVGSLIYPEKNRYAAHRYVTLVTAYGFSEKDVEGYSSELNDVKNELYNKWKKILGGNVSEFQVILESKHIYCELIESLLEQEKELLKNKRLPPKQDAVRTCKVKKVSKTERQEAIDWLLRIDEKFFKSEVKDLNSDGVSLSRTCVHLLLIYSDFFY